MKPKKMYAEVNLLELTFRNGKPWLDQVGISYIKVTDEPESGKDNQDDEVCFTMTSKEWERWNPCTPLYDNIFAWGFADPCSSLEEGSCFGLDEDIPPMRMAIVDKDGLKLDDVQQYLPLNYGAYRRPDGRIQITGRDDGGRYPGRFSLDGYVIKVLAEKGIPAREFTSMDVEARVWQKEDN